jgi:hypothetical protein
MGLHAVSGGELKDVPTSLNIDMYKEVFLKAILRAYISASSVTLRRSCIQACPCRLKERTEMGFVSSIIDMYKEVFLKAIVRACISASS